MTNGKRPVSDLERYFVLALIAVFAVLVAAAYVESLIDHTYHPDATLAGLGTAIVGGALTHFVVTRDGRRPPQ